jgi:hypothetical protein
MNASEAKRKLSLYRGAIDDNDPQFREALAYAGRDPEMAEWLHEHRGCYDALRLRLQSIEPPAGLAERIVAQRPIPFRRDPGRILPLAAAIILSTALTLVAMKLWDRRAHQVTEAKGVTVKGEVIDMTCYVAYNLSGPEHAECARVCIRNGMPVGIKAQDGKVYLLTGQPGYSVNAQLADYAAKIVTIKGQETERNGFSQVQVEEIQSF